jgi:hypothetical protein
VISSRLLSGRTLIHVYSDNDPGDGFEEAIGDRRRTSPPSPAATAPHQCD